MPVHIKQQWHVSNSFEGEPTPGRPRYSGIEQGLTVPPSLADQLETVRNMEDIDKQYFALETGYHRGMMQLPKQVSGSEVDQLINFAADPKSSPSLLVRAQAFELAVTALTKKQPDTEDPRFDYLKTELAHFMSGQMQKESTHVKNVYHRDYTTGEDIDVSGYEINPFGVRNMAYNLAKQEGINTDDMFPDWGLLGYAPDYQEILPDNIPIAAFYMLSKFSSRINSYDPGQDPLRLSPFAKLLPLAIDMQKAVDYQVADVNNADEIYQDAEEIRALLDAPGSEKYLEPLDALKDSIMSLAVAFPDEYRTGVYKGAQALFHDCVYAVRHHLENRDYSTIAIPINGNMDDPLRLKLSDDEPLEWILVLQEAIAMIHSQTSNDESFTTIFNQDNAKGFKVFRIWQEDGSKNNIYAYVRPRAAQTYDHSVEYGRNGQGVEASIGYVVDPSIKDGEIIEVGKHRGDSVDNRISIRLDRDGFAPDTTSTKDLQRDPEIEQGALSLDIGSVIGDPDWLGTKIGRFLAWGNYLRTAKLGREPGLNHVRRYFEDEHGTADNFESNATAFARELERHRITKRSLGVLASRQKSLK